MNSCPNLCDSVGSSNFGMIVRSKIKTRCSFNTRFSSKTRYSFTRLPIQGVLSKLCVHSKNVVYSKQGVHSLEYPLTVPSLAILADTTGDHCTTITVVIVNNNPSFLCFVTGYRMPASDGTPEEMYRLMLRCWEYKPENRPHFDQILNIVEGITSTIR